MPVYAHARESVGAWVMSGGKAGEGGVLPPPELPVPVLLTPAGGGGRAGFGLPSKQVTHVIGEI